MFHGPSLIGFLTTDALLLSSLIVLDVFATPFRIVIAPKHFWPTTDCWFLLSFGISCIGLDLLTYYGTVNDLLMSFVWNVVYIAFFSALRLGIHSVLGEQRFSSR